MKLKVEPPDGFSAASCKAHLRQVARTRTCGATVRLKNGYLELAGSVPDLIPLRFLLRRFGYSIR